MPAARCQCPPHSKPSMMCVVPPCPCLRCKERALEMKNSDIQSVAKSKAGICGKCISGVQIGKPTGGAPCGGSSMRPGMGSSPGTGAPRCSCSGATMGTGKGQGMGPGKFQPMNSGRGPPTGQGAPKCKCGSAAMSPTELGGYPGKYPPTSQTPEKCKCPGAFMDLSTNPMEDLCNSNEGNGLRFGDSEYGWKSSINDVADRASSIIHQGGCNADIEAVIGISSTKYSNGRDTLGLPIQMKKLLNASGSKTCLDTTVCDQDCGRDTGCKESCHMRNGAQPSSNVIRSKMLQGSGIQMFGNEYINTIITFLMEVTSILIFFAICTITFWITLGYYIVNLLIDLKNADRHVHVALGVVFGLLVVAFTISLVMHGHGACHKRAKSLSVGVSSVGSRPKCHTKMVAKAPKKVQVRTPIVTTPVTKPKNKPKCCAPKKVRKRYTDCEGRTIFDTSRRNAILTEMKQPPTWLVWLHDYIQAAIS